MDPKVIPAHQRKLLETVDALSFEEDKSKMAGRLGERAAFIF